MKKLLLSLAVLAASAFGVFAETLNFKDWNFPDADKWSSSYAEHVITFDNAIVTFKSANKQSTTITDCPVTKGGNITIAAKDGEKLASVTFNLVQWTTKAQTATLYVSSDGTTFTSTEISSTNFTLTGETLPAGTVAAQVQFSSTSNQVGCASIEFTLATGAAAELKPAGLSFSEPAFTIYADKISEFETPTLTNPNNLTVTYASDKEDVATVATDGTVTLTGSTGTAKITASFAGNAEFGAGSASYTITVKPTPTAVATIAATTELTSGTEFIVNYDLTVAYAKGSNVFAYTADKEFIQLYGSNSYEVGDIIAKGWVGQYALYNNGAVPEIKPVGAFPAAAYKSEVAFVPAEVAAADVKAELVNHVIVVKGVTFATGITAGKTTTNGTVGQTTLAFYNSFELAAQEAGIYNVTAVVQIYSGKVQLYPTAYELVEGGETPEPVEPEVTEVKTVAETIALADNTKVKIGYALTVAFSNAGNIFTCDEAGNFIQVFAKDKKNSYKSGDVIPAGWEATYKLYNGVTPELEIASVDGLPEATEGTFTPKAVAFADITVAMVNNVVKIEKVVFDVATPSSKTNFTGKIGETEVALRNNYALASVEAGTYNVTVVITLFKATGATEYAPSLYVVNFEPVKTDGINEIEAEAAEAVYYNLQGVEVKNPANGVYIVRRGAKVTKEFIR